MRVLHRVLLLSVLLAGVTFGNALGVEPGVTVSLRVSMRSKQTAQQASPPALLTGSNTIVAWLTPVDVSSIAQERLPLPVPAQSFVLTQKDKQFIPHLLVIPTGSSVEFPNLDPFFHNVFSLFNGRRFDLGLYEAGSRRTVRFDHAGVSYIFCNIHPEMGAVIVSLSTPFYAIASADGGIVFSHIPAGDYTLDLWSQNISPEDQAAAKQHIHVSGKDLRLSPIALQQAVSFSDKHLNKFGEAYKTQDQAPY